MTASRYYRFVTTTPTPQRKLPWYYEDPGPAFFNGWSLVHVGSGALFQTLVPNRPILGLALHTAYEAIEGFIFTREDRDPSMRNHIGDTIAFAAGMWLASAIDRKPNDR